MHRSLATPSPTLDDFDRFFGDPVVLHAIAQAMTDGSIVLFELSVGEDVRGWTLHRTDGSVNVRPPNDTRVDCTLRCSGESFRNMLVGNLSPRHGFLTGLLDVQGDVGIVLGLRKAVLRMESAA